jgi:hypothetical protein
VGHTSFLPMLMILIGQKHNIKKSIEALLDARKEAGLQVIAEKTKYMFMFHH